MDDSAYQLVHFGMGQRHVWSTEGRNDVDSRSFEFVSFEDRHCLPLAELGFAEGIDFIVVAGEKRGYAKPTPRAEAPAKSPSVGLEHLRMKLVAPDD
jgi:hypothetical protein